MKQGWTYKKFSEVFNLQMGKTPSRDNSGYWGGNNVWVSISDLKGKYVGGSKEHITDLGVSSSGITKVPQGTAIMSFKLTIGRAAIADCDLYTNEAIMSFMPKQKDILLAEYIYYYLSGCKWTGANKAVMGQTLNKKTISENIFAYPSIEVQKEICSLLDKLNLLIEKKKEQIAELDNLAQSLFYDMFGDPITNEKGWNAKTLKDVGKIITGSTPSTKNVENYNSSDFCFVKPSDIEKDSITRISKTEFYISQSAYDNSRKLPKGSVLVTCIGIVGKTGILEVDATCNQQINAIVPNAYCNSLYVAYSVLLSKRIIEAMANAPVVPIINKGEFSKISIPIPPLPLQQSFAEKVEAIERQKELINQSIKEVQTLLDAKMDYYFGE